MRGHNLASVVLMCYNQKEYIPQAITCILEQKCDFEFEIADKLRYNREFRNTGLLFSVTVGFGIPRRVE